MNFLLVSAALVVVMFVVTLAVSWRFCAASRHAARWIVDFLCGGLLASPWCLLTCGCGVYIQKIQPDWLLGSIVLWVGGAGLVCCCALLPAGLVLNHVFLRQK